MSASSKSPREVRKVYQKCRVCLDRFRKVDKGQCRHGRDHGALAKPGLRAIAAAAAATPEPVRNTAITDAEKQRAMAVIATFDPIYARNADNVRRRVSKRRS